MLYQNVKTGNILAPANEAQENLMARSPLYAPVRPAPLKEPEPEAPAGDTDPPQEQKTAKKK